MQETKILLFTDMHGDRRSVDIAEKILEKDKFDMIIYLGDFSEKIGESDANEEDLAYMVHKLGGFGDFYSLFGNCDSPELQKTLEDKGFALHNRLIFIGKTAIIGWGGSHPTPFNTPGEFDEEEIRESLSKLMDDAAAKGAERLILVTHEPPFETNADKLPDGPHVGSKALREIVEEYQPNIDICGHIHEAKSTDSINGSKIVNIGPASEGHFLALHVDGEIKDEEINI
jgi:hypothetical protein